MDCLSKVKIAKRAVDDKKGQKVKVIKVADLTVLCEYFVIASGTSSTQVRALADEVDYQLGQEGVHPRKIEGYRSEGWVLLDYGDVVVHLFLHEKRDFYGLERIWADGMPVELDD